MDEVDSCIVDQDVQAAECVHRLLDGRLRRRLFRHVGGKEAGTVCPKLADELAAGLRPAGDQHLAGAFRAEEAGDDQR